MDATATIEKDIVGGDGGDSDDKNVSEEHTHSVGGEGDDDELSDEASGASVSSSENLGGPYKVRCDTHGHMPGTFKCLIPQSNGLCGMSYCRLCLARNSAKCIMYLPYHFQKMCPVCHTHFLNHVKYPLDSEFSFRLETHKVTDPFPTIHYKKSPVQTIKPPLTTARSPSPSPPPPPPSRKKGEVTSKDNRCSSRVAKRKAVDDKKALLDASAIKKARCDYEKKRRQEAVQLRRETVSIFFSIICITRLILYL